MRRLTLLLFVFAVSFVHADPVCNTFPQPLTGGYCIYPGSQLNKDLVYYFHGRETDETVTDVYTRWGDQNFYTQQIRDYWKAKGLAEPTVISVSFGNIFLLNEQLLNVLTQQVIPMLENSIGGLKGRRMVIGESMGGFNSTEVALRTGLAEKAAILCAPMVDGVSPFSTPEQINAYVLASTAYSYHGQAGEGMLEQNVSDSVMLARYFFPTEAEWNAADPLQLAANIAVGDAPRQMYVAAGFYDPFVLYEGNLKFVENLQKSGVSVEWRPQWGGHCAIDIPSVAEFLIK